MSFADVDAAAKAAEEAEGPHGRRVCKVFCDANDAPELWHGTFGNAPVEPGAPAVQMSDGIIVEFK